MAEDVVDSVPQRCYRHGRRTVEEEVQFQRIWCGEDAGATVAHVPLASFSIQLHDIKLSPNLSRKIELNWRFECSPQPLDI